MGLEGLITLGLSAEQLPSDQSITITVTSRKQNWTIIGERKKNSKNGGDSGER
jgi:hypothetical protein